jgi:hypothetical protein
VHLWSDSRSDWDDITTLITANPKVKLKPEMSCCLSVFQFVGIRIYEEIDDRPHDQVRRQIEILPIVSL